MSFRPIPLSTSDLGLMRAWAQLMQQLAHAIGASGSDPFLIPVQSAVIGEGTPIEAGDLLRGQPSGDEQIVRGVILAADQMGGYACGVAEDDIANGGSGQMRVGGLATVNFVAGLAGLDAPTNGLRFAPSAAVPGKATTSFSNVRPTGIIMDASGYSEALGGRLLCLILPIVESAPIA